jgi:hypothetical protein
VQGDLLGAVDIAGNLVGTVGASVGSIAGAITVRGAAGMGASGLIHAGADLAGSITLTGAMAGMAAGSAIIAYGTGGGAVSGEISMNGDLAGSIESRGGVTSRIRIGGRISGEGAVVVADGLRGWISVGGDVTSARAEGAIRIGGDVLGSNGVTIGGNLDGLIAVDGLVTESSGISVAGNLNFNGAIAAGGLTSGRTAGAIAVGGGIFSGQPASLHIGAGGIAAAASVVVGGTAYQGNAIQVDGTFHGLIQVGASGGGVFGQVILLSNLSHGTLKASARNDYAQVLVNNPAALTYVSVQGATSGDDYGILFGIQGPAG